MTAPGGLRIGLGYDSHRYDTERPLILGGVHFPESPGLSGHSDGDAVAHAVIDAVLGAAALGDVGSHFPPDDDTWEGADSMKLLERSMVVLADAGWCVGNVDVTVICQRPRIGPRKAELQASLAAALRIPAACVSVKGKTNETMGWIGREEGLGVHAVALIYPCDHTP